MSPDNFYFYALVVPFLFLGLTVHEFAHAWMANQLGDDTAARAGRLSLNPFRHLDLLGTLVLFITQFIGWAKPVPVDPANFRHPLRGLSLVAAAGPIANITLAIILAFAFHFGLDATLIKLFPNNIAFPLIQMCLIGFKLNLFLGIFNLIPLPPLDGFNILMYFLPTNVAKAIQKRRIIAFIILMAILISGTFAKIVEPIFDLFKDFIGLE
ncbi:MAG: site-2 protease family protein [Deltaproteobacteria bacterium]|jgi:Zn-dependent protease|nr:site-2 protease family protein [Deltaproteobacteria bacterium]